MDTTRTTRLKTSLSKTESADVHRECNLVGVTRSEKARELLLHWVSQQRNSRRPIGHREGPSEVVRRTQSLPCRKSYGVVPKMHLRV